MDFSREALAEDLFGRAPGGRERELVQQSLTRLSNTRITIGGYDATKRIKDFACAFQNVPLLERVDRIGSAVWRAYFPRWLVDQLASDYVTWLDWETLRSLDGLAKRMWIYFEAESSDRFHIVLSGRALQTLAIHTHRRADAYRGIRETLDRLKTLGLAYEGRIIDSWAGPALDVKRPITRRRPRGEW